MHINVRGSNIESHAKILRLFYILLKQINFIYFCKYLSWVSDIPKRKSLSGHTVGDGFDLFIVGIIHEISEFAQ